MTQVGTIIADKYEIQKEIGRGGMSVVYLAMDTHLNKLWAVKEIRKQAGGNNDEIVVNSLLAEANLMKRLDHPALPRIVDIIDNGVTIYVVMDYIEGESLDKVLAMSGPRSEEDVVAWAKQIADALSYLHSQKPPIIYRDMKPANVMLRPEGTIKIIDFGIAREYKEQNVADTTVLGTKGYAPPEQYNGQTDPRSDIYALGMTMHHLLTGVDPRNGEAYAPPRSWNPDISEGVEIIINTCVQPAAENRYQSCADLIYDLEHPDLITSGFKKKQRRKLGAFIASAALCVLLAISGVVCGKLSENIKNSTYDAYISVMASTPLEEKIESYKQGITLFPYDTRAYMKMLEAYEDEGRFSEAESSQFLALYNANKDGFDATSVEVAELNYKIGMMYFNYYTDASGGVSLSTRIQKAYPSFAANYENAEIPASFAEKGLSDCYYLICSFFKKYIINTATVDEASKTDYQSLFETINDAFQDLEGASAYNRLSFYNGVFMLVYDCRQDLAYVGYELSEVLELFDYVYKESEALTVRKEQAEKLRQEIVNNYASYREAIERAYSNTAERS